MPRDLDVKLTLVSAIKPLPQLMFTNIFIIIWASLVLNVLRYNGHKMKEYSALYPTSQKYYCKLYLVEISCLTPNNYNPGGNIWYGIVTLCHHWFRLRMFACMVPNHYLKNADLLSNPQEQSLVKLESTKLFHQLNWFENFFGKMLTICLTSMCWWAMIMVEVNWYIFVNTGSSNGLLPSSSMP